MSTYITSLGTFLPGEPIDNASMEEYLGRINGKASRARARILKQNGIETRYYAIDKQQQTLFSNAEMAASAVQVRSRASRPAADGRRFSGGRDGAVRSSAARLREHGPRGDGVPALRNRDAARRVRERRDGA